MDIQTYHRQLDDMTAQFVKAFKPLSSSQLNYKPNAETWSIAQNMEHLILINESYYPLIQQIRDGSFRLAWYARFGFVRRFFTQLVWAGVHPDRRRKIKTLSIWQPSNSNVTGDIVAKWEAHQAEFKQFASNCQDLIAQGQIIHSPASRIIVYDLEKAFELMLLHEQRHFEQAKELLINIKKN